MEPRRNLQPSLPSLGKSPCIRPRTWLEKKGADRAVAINMALSVLLLLIAIALILVLDLGDTVSIG